MKKQPSDDLAALRREIADLKQGEEDYRQRLEKKNIEIAELKRLLAQGRFRGFQAQNTIRAVSAILSNFGAHFGIRVEVSELEPKP